MAKSIVFQTGGPYHPVSQQGEMFRAWMPDGWQLNLAHSTEAFELLNQCDLFVAGGLNWTGLGAAGDGHEWFFDEQFGYRPACDAHKRAFRKYVGSGKPVLGYHGGIASYDDWPEFGQLLGVRWDWNVSNHGPIQEWTMAVADTSHPIAEGLGGQEYTLQMEEVYGNLQIAQDSPYEVICKANFHGMSFPVLFAGEGGRCEGSGKWAYFGNGHSLEAIQCPAFQPLLINTIKWLLDESMA